MSALVILPSLEIPESPGNLRRALPGSGRGSPGVPGVKGCEQQWGGNLPKRRGVTFPGRAASAPMRRALCHRVPARDGAWAGRSRCSQLPWGRAARPGSSPAWQRRVTSDAAASLRTQVMPKPSATTASGRVGLSPGVGRAAGEHRSPPLPWQHRVQLGHGMALTRRQVPPPLLPPQCCQGRGTAG